MKNVMVLSVLMAFSILAAPAVSAQMTHQNMMQDTAAHYGMNRNHMNRGSMMPGCQNCMMGQSMMGGSMMGRSMMDGERMGMMDQRMMGMMGMMGNQMPMHPYMAMVNMLPSMQQKLSLTDDQVSRLIDLQSSFRKEAAGYEAGMQKGMLKLRSLVKNGGSSAEVKKQLESCSESRISLQVAAYDTFTQMKSVLDASQSKQLEGMMEHRQDGGRMGMNKGQWSY